MLIIDADHLIINPYISITYLRVTCAGIVLFNLVIRRRPNGVAEEVTYLPEVSS